MKRFFWNRHSKLLLRYILGWFCIVLGIIMLVTPGQGILTILIGVYLLADHVPIFGKLKVWMHGKFPKTSAYVSRKKKLIQNRFRKKRNQ